jgi:hypothetical protein
MRERNALIVPVATVRRTRGVGMGPACTTPPPCLVVTAPMSGDDVEIDLRIEPVPSPLVAWMTGGTERLRVLVADARVAYEEWTELRPAEARQRTGSLNRLSVAAGLARAQG